jgi:hypothetical protein
MKITTVRYRRLQSHDRGYGHDAVEAEAQVDQGEDADAAFAALREWVLYRLGTIREVDQHLETLDRLRNAVQSEKRYLDGLKADVKRGREIIEKHEKLADLAREHGIEVEAANLIDDGIPF